VHTTDSKQVSTIEGNHLQSMPISVHTRRP